MEKARSNTELYSNPKTSLNNVKPSNFWGSHHNLIAMRGRETRLAGKAEGPAG